MNTIYLTAYKTRHWLNSEQTKALSKEIAKYLNQKGTLDFDEATNTRFLNLLDNLNMPVGLTDSETTLYVRLRAEKNSNVRRRRIQDLINNLFSPDTKFFMSIAGADNFEHEKKALISLFKVADRLKIHEYDWEFPAEASQTMVDLQYSVERFDE